MGSRPHAASRTRAAASSGRRSRVRMVISRFSGWMSVVARAESRVLRAAEPQAGGRRASLQRGAEAVAQERGEVAGIRRAHDAGGAEERVVAPARGARI